MSIIGTDERKEVKDFDVAGNSSIVSIDSVDVQVPSAVRSAASGILTADGFVLTATHVIHTDLRNEAGT